MHKTSTKQTQFSHTKIFFSFVCSETIESSFSLMSWRNLEVTWAPTTIRRLINTKLCAIAQKESLKWMEKNEIINVQFSGLIYSQFLFFCATISSCFSLRFLNFKYEWNFYIKLSSWLKILFCEKLSFKKKSKSECNVWAAKSFIFPLKLRISFNFGALKKLKQSFFFHCWLQLTRGIREKNVQKSWCSKRLFMFFPLVYQLVWIYYAKL